MQLPRWALQAPEDLKLRMPLQNPDNPSLFPTFQTVNAISTSKQFSLQFPTRQTTDSISTAKNYSFNFLNIKEKVPFQYPNNSGFNILHIKQSIPFQYPNNPSLVSWTSNGISNILPNHKLWIAISPSHLPNFISYTSNAISASNWLIFMFYTSNVISTCSQLIFFLLHIKCHFDIQPIFISYTSNVISTDKPTYLHYLHTNYHFNPSNSSSVPTHQMWLQYSTNPSPFPIHQMAFHMQPTLLHSPYIEWHFSNIQATHLQ